MKSYMCTLTDTTTLWPSHPNFHLTIFVFLFPHFSYINKQIYNRVLRRITYMPKVCQISRKYSLLWNDTGYFGQGQIMGRASQTTSGGANLQAALWHHRNNQKYGAGYHVWKNFSEIYPRYGHSLSVRFTSLVPGQKRLKEYQFDVIPNY